MANHRADKRGHTSRTRADSPAAATTSRTRAHASSRRRKPLPGLPSAPTLAGAAALLVAAAGAITVGQQSLSPDLAAGNLQRLSAQASVLSGSSSIGSNAATANRERAVSRDSERAALQDAASDRLQAAAEAQAKARNVALQALAASAEKHANAMARNAWQLPIPAGVYHLTGRFGQSSGLWANTHTGLDFAAPSGTPIHAVARGTVAETGYSGAYGNRTIITLEDGTEVWYCHQSSFAVSPGDEVSAGQVIGTVGSTGNSTGPHLHLEVRPGAGDPVDPQSALMVHNIRP